MKAELLDWLRGKLKEAEKAVLAREQMAETERGGTEEIWRAVAKATGPPYRGKAERERSAQAQDRIAVKCRRDLRMFYLTIAIVERSEEPAKNSDSTEQENPPVSST